MKDMDLSLLARKSATGTTARNSATDVPPPSFHWKTRLALPGLILLATAAIVFLTARDVLMPRTPEMVAPPSAVRAVWSSFSSASRPVKSSGGRRSWWRACTPVGNASMLIVAPCPIATVLPVIAPASMLPSVPGCVVSSLMLSILHYDAQNTKPAYCAKIDAIVGNHKDCPT